MSLHKIQAFGSSFDVEIQRIGEKLQVTVLNQGKVCVKKTEIV